MADGFVEYLSKGAYEELVKGGAELERQIGLVGQLNDARGKAKTPSGSDAAVKQLNDQLIAQDKLIKKLQEDYLKLAEVKKANQKLTTEEIVNQGILNRQARQSAIINSTLAGAYDKLSAAEAKAAKRVQDLIASNGRGFDSQVKFNSVLKTAQREFDELRAKILKADAAVGRWQRTGERTIAMGRDLVSAFGLVTGVALFAAVAKDIFDTTRELQSLDLALKQVLGSQEEAAAAQTFLSKIAEDYGINIQVLTKSYIGFFAASKNAIDSGAISAKQIRDIFQSVSKAAGAMGLSVDQQQGAFLALSQMISKGNVQAEELRGQLSERLPGAFGILAKSMGVTEVELNKMLKEGKVLAAEVLPAFAKELEKAYGVENLERVETLNAATTRLSNTWTEFVRTLNEGDGVFSKTLTTLLTALNNVLKGFDYLFSSSTAKRQKLNEELYSSSYNEAKKYYEYVQNESGKGAKLAEEEIRNNSSYAAKKARDNAEQVKWLQAANEELRKSGKIKTPFGTQIRGENLKQIRLNNDAIFALNQSTSRYNGQVQAANDLLEENTKKTVANTEAKKKGRQTDPYGAELNARLRYLKALKEANDQEYQAERAYVERQIEEDEKLAKNEKLNFETRLEAYGRYLKRKEDLIVQDLIKANMLIDEQTEIEKEQARKDEAADIKRATGGKSLANQTAVERAAVAKIVQYWSDQTEMIDQKGRDKKIENDTKAGAETQKVAEDTGKAVYEINKRINDLLLATDKSYRDEQITLFKKVADNEKMQLELRQASYNAWIALRRKQMDLDKAAELELSNGSKAEYDAIIAKFQVLQRALNAEQEEQSPFAVAIKNANEELLSLRKTLTEGVFSDAGFASLGKFFDGTFDKVMEGFDKIENRQERFKKQFAYTFAAIGEIAKEAYAYIQQANQQAFEAQAQRIEQEYEISLAFAGKGAEAKAEVDRVYEQKRKQLARERAKSEKEGAIFNAIVNTAAGVVAALANPGGPAGIVLAALVGILGGLQIATIASTPLPAYKTGRYGGRSETAMVDEEGAEIITDSNWRIKSKGQKGGARKVRLDAGDNVIPAHISESILSGSAMFDKNLNNMLSGSNISLQNNASLDIDYNRLGDVIMQGVKSMPKGESYQPVYDQWGIEFYKIRNGQRTKVMNASLNNKSLNV